MLVENMEILQALSVEAEKVTTAELTSRHDHLIDQIPRRLSDMARSGYVRKHGKKGLGKHYSITEKGRLKAGTSKNSKPAALTGEAGVELIEAAVDNVAPTLGIDYSVEGMTIEQLIADAKLAKMLKVELFAMRDNINRLLGTREG